MVELRRLRAEQPDLAPAVDLQLALIELQRRVHPRVPLPACLPTDATQRLVPTPGQGLLRFADLPLDWSDFRRLLHETATLLKRFDAIEADDYGRLLDVTRAGATLEPMVRAWYEATSSWGGAEPVGAPRAGGPEGAAGAEAVPEAFGDAFSLALRPVLQRCAQALMPALDLSAWREARCPLCGGEPELAVFDAAGERALVCSRCTARWPFASGACPHCGNGDPARLRSFASRDRAYRVEACDACHRYVKAFDERRGARPVLPPVDTIATLPLDAAAFQHGYRA